VPFPSAPPPPSAPLLSRTASPTARSPQAPTRSIFRRPHPRQHPHQRRRAVVEHRAIGSLASWHALESCGGSFVKCSCRMPPKDASSDNKFRMCNGRDFTFTRSFTKIPEIARKCGKSCPCRFFARAQKNRSFQRRKTGFSQGRPKLGKCRFGARGLESPAVIWNRLRVRILVAKPNRTPPQWLPRMSTQITDRMPSLSRRLSSGRCP